MSECKRCPKLFYDIHTEECITQLHYFKRATYRECCLFHVMFLIKKLPCSKNIREIIKDYVIKSGGSKVSKYKEYVYKSSKEYDEKTRRIINNVIWTPITKFKWVVERTEVIFLLTPKEFFEKLEHGCK